MGWTNGCLLITSVRQGGPPRPPGWSQIKSLSESEKNLIRIRYHALDLIDQSGATMSVKSLEIPFWELALLAALLPAVWIARRWRQRRPPPGHCRVCGYDLRATPERCPECGAIPES
jgi:rubrerythrin